MSLYFILLDFPFEKNSYIPFFVCSFVVTACCFVRNPLLVFFQINNLFQYLPFKRFWDHQHNLLAFFPLSFAIHIVFSCQSVKTTISFALQLSHFCASDFLFEEAGFSFVVLLMVTAASTRKQELMVNWLKWHPYSLWFVKNPNRCQLCKSCSDKAKQTQSVSMDRYEFL